MLSRPPFALAASTSAWQALSSADCRARPGAAERGGQRQARRAGGAGEDARDLGVVELAGEAVGGEQVEVAGLGGVDGDVRLDRGLRADGAGDDVADRRGGGLDAAEHAGADLLLDQGVVLGEECEGAARGRDSSGCRRHGRSRAVGVAAARPPQRRDQGGAHAVQAVRLLRVPVDGLVGSADGSMETGVGMVGGIRPRAWGAVGWLWARSRGRAVRIGMGEAVKEGLAGQMAGDLAGGGAAHAVADDEGSMLGQGGAGVLVGVADAAGMGEHGEGAVGARVGRRRRGGGDLRLARGSESQYLPFRHPGSPQFGTVETILLAAVQSKGLDPGSSGQFAVCKAPFGIVWSGNEEEAD